MRYAIISDIHGNLEALKAVIAACQEQGARKYLCLGDVVGYGANPNECIDLLRQIKAVCVAGNHDYAVVGKKDTHNFTDAAKEAIVWTKNNLSDEDLCYLKGLEYVYQNQDFVMVHGTLDDPQCFTYLRDLSQAKDTFYLMKRQVCFVGHTHEPQVLVQHKAGVSYGKTFETELVDCNKYIFNAGSVGQPRDGNPMACYCLYDPDLKRVEIKRVKYDLELTQRKILEAGLPEKLAFRLRIGQ